MTTHLHADRPTITEMSQAEWDTAVQHALDRLHLTYEELREMAVRRDFASLDARKLWLAIGDQEGPRSADAPIR
jgi:hypothetical protein